MASKPTRDYWRRVILENFEERLPPPQMDELRSVLDQWEGAILDAAIARSERERLKEDFRQLREKTNA